MHHFRYYAIQQGLLTVAKQNKKNVFSGRILEIEGLGHLKCEQAFELSDASAERSAAGCAIAMNPEPIAEYLKSNIVMLQWMVAEGYGDARTIERRVAAMEAWLANPELLKADKGASYVHGHVISLMSHVTPVAAEVSVASLSSLSLSLSHTHTHTRTHTSVPAPLPGLFCRYTATIDINLADITEPIVCCPNDPDDARLLSTVAGDKIDEVQHQNRSVAPITRSVFP